MKHKIRSRALPGWFPLLLLAVLIAVILVSIIFGVYLGSVGMNARTVLDVIRMKLFGVTGLEVKASAVSIIWELRLPRVLLAIASGGGLAVAGAAMQSVTTNVMADPYILGASGGASAAVALAFVIGSLYTSSAAISAFAFGGAMLALVLVYAVGMSGRSGNTNRLVLAGMAVSVILTAATHFFISIAPDEHAVKSITAWTMGSLASARWSNLAFPCFCAIAGSVVFMLISRAYNLLSQGDETAVSLGVNVPLVRRATIIVVAFITGGVVAAGGVIGFVGFIIPHIVRMLIGADHRKVFPFAFLMGGLFLMWMDVLARTVVSPKELPVGVFTAFCGGPFFIWLLFRRKKK